MVRGRNIAQQGVRRHFFQLSIFPGGLYPPIQSPSGALTRPPSLPPPLPCPLPHGTFLLTEMRASSALRPGSSAEGAMVPL